MVLFLSEIHKMSDTDMNIENSQASVNVVG